MRSAKKYLVGLSTAAMVLGTIATGAGVSAATVGSPSFSDIAGNTEAGAITFMATLGIVNGVGNGLYDPSAPVTRQQMAKMVVNLIGKGSVAAALANTPSSFTDAASIEPDLLGYVNVAADMGIIKGYPDGSFGPTAPVTDAEAAAMILRAIGDDQPGIVTGTWPGNYVAAAFGGSSQYPLSGSSTDIQTGVTFVSNLPASRGDVAQMLYNAALFIPTYTAEPSANGVVSFAAGKPLYQGGSVGGNEVYQGTVTGVSASSVALGTTGSWNWESSYQLVGVTSVSTLIGQSVVVNVDSNGNVDYLALAPGAAATADTGTLADGNTPVPSGYFVVNGNYPFMVTNSYDCSNPYAGGDVAIANWGVSVNGADCATSYYLLLGGSTAKTVQLATYQTSTGGTTFQVNPSSDGSDLGIVAGGTADLTQDASVSYTVNSSNKVSSLVETNSNDQIGVVTSTWCATGCDNGINAAATPQIQLTINGTNYVVNLQAYTQMTLNGATVALSKSLDNDVAYASIVGGYGVYNNQANAGTGDKNATNVALYNNQVSGTVTAVSTGGNANNLTGGNSGQVLSFTLSLSNGSSETYTADANFNGNGVALTPGIQATVALDSAGQAREILSTTASSSASVALVLYTGTSATSSGTSYTIDVADSSGNSEIVDLTGNYLTGEGNTVYNSTYFNSLTLPNGNNGMVAFVTNASGQAVAPNTTNVLPEALHLDSVQVLFPHALSTDYLQVVTVTSSSAVLGLYNAAGNIDYANANSGNAYVSLANGGAFQESNGNWLGFGGLGTGKGNGATAVWQGTDQNGAAIYAIVQNQ